MANFTSSILSIIPLFVAFLCFSGGNVVTNAYDHDYDDDGSFVPTRPCKRPKITPEENPWHGGASMIVMNRWCGVEKDMIPSEEEFLEYDAARVRSIQARLAAPPTHKDDAALTAHPGLNFGATGYVVQVQLGTPPQSQLLMFDTGSDVAWIQCNTCEVAKKCFSHNQTLFNPDGSIPISCQDPECQKLPRRKCVPHSKPCHLSIGYLDGSSVFGQFYKDVLHLGGSQDLNDFVFGCTSNYTEAKGHSTLKGFSGILGLGDAEGSFVNRVRHQFGRYFSYCLPTGKGEDKFGHLTLGPSNRLKSRTKVSSEIIRNEQREYLVALEDITVGRKRLGIDKAVFRATKGTLIDSGTFATRLPKAAYEALRDEFRSQMQAYPMVIPTGGVFDTCYDLSGRPQPQHIPIPSVTLHFKEQDQIQLHPEGVMGGNFSKRCLLFTSIDKGDTVSIIGYKAQQTFDVIYDLDHRTILFGPNGCN